MKPFDGTGLTFSFSNEYTGVNEEDITTQYNSQTTGMFSAATVDQKDYTGSYELKYWSMVQKS